MKSILVIAFIFSVSISCVNDRYLGKKIIRPVLMVSNIDNVQRELDDIFMLLTYSLVFKDWQSDSIPRNKRRGYNIGALLINKNNEPVGYDYNCINSTNDATQHGEVRVITKYIDKLKCFDINGFSLYTTLEPCVMCAGMITMTSAKRLVYGQHDVEYSKAFERLAIDTRSIGGFGPYPRKVTVESSSISFCKELDTLYLEFLANENEKILAKFLSSSKARDVFERAHYKFLHYSLQYSVNQKTLDNALSFYKQQIKNH